MNLRKTVLLIAGIACIALLYTVPIYHEWIQLRFFSLENDISFGEQLKHMDIEQRRECRFGPSYLFYRNISHQLSQTANPVLLLPPNDYLRIMHVADLQVPMPPVFYYFTGINAVSAESPLAGQANWAILVRGPDDIYISRIRSHGQLDTILKQYRSFQN